MATAIKSASVTIADNLANRSSSASGNARITNGSRLKSAVDTIEIGTDQITGSIIRMFRVRSNWNIQQLLIKCDDVGSTGNVDVGLYRTSADGGAVVDSDCYATAIILTTAITSTDTTGATSIAFEARDVALIKQLVWADGGYTTDPGLDFDLCFTCMADTEATITVSAQLEYTDGS